MMLTSGMKEELTSTLVIQDFDFEVVEALIKWIYLGQVDMTKGDKLMDLILVGDKYQLTSFDDLFATCQDLVAQHVNLDNVLQVKTISFFFHIFLIFKKFLRKIAAA